MDTLTVLYSIVEHVGSGQSTEEVREKHETWPNVSLYFLSSVHCTPIEHALSQRALYPNFLIKIYIAHIIFSFFTFNQFFLKGFSVSLIQLH